MKAIAIRVHENLPVHVDVDDMVHAGILGLFDAADEVRSEEAGGLLELRQAPHQGRDSGQPAAVGLGFPGPTPPAQTGGSDHARADGELCSAHPPMRRWREKMGVDVERWRQMMLDLRNVGLISASTRGSEQEDLPAPEFPGKPDTQPDSMCAREQTARRSRGCDEDAAGTLSEGRVRSTTPTR